tara:strand:- start:1131 stop:1739 length:609 start_codon:yes stop_codon:yes gene_type:complete
MPNQIIQQGAEAQLIKKSPSILLKHRIKKSYRIPELDNKIRKRRTKKEAKILEKISKIIPVPELIKTDDKEKIEMQFIKGKKLSEHLDKLPNATKVCETIGTQIATLHDSEIIHGDLTTSNMILSNSKLYFIDFGLSFHSSRVEDKAVDLHLIKQALEAKHFSNYKEFFLAIQEGYKSSKQSKQVLERLKKVESRGRYKQQY